MGSVRTLENIRVFNTDIAGLLAKTVLLIAVALSVGCQRAVPVLETGPDTVCRSDTDCWCRKFTGAQFTEGKEKSFCKNNRCVKCMYD